MKHEAHLQNNDTNDTNDNNDSNDNIYDNNGSNDNNDNNGDNDNNSDDRISGRTFEIQKKRVIQKIRPHPPTIT